MEAVEVEADLTFKVVAEAVQEDLEKLNLQQLLTRLVLYVDMALQLTE